VMHRVTDVQALLLLSIFTGLIHLAAGFLLGFANEWEHGKKHAAVKLAWLAVEIGGVLAVAGFLFGAVSPEFAQAGLGLLVLGTAVIVWGEGLIGIFEIPGLASNIMSYARIAAVGIAGVILAEAINSLVLPDAKMLATPQGMVLFAAMSIAYITLHIVNTIIAMFESFVHGARLNFVEFFGKFFKGNGIRFMPFAAKRRYTAEY